MRISALLAAAGLAAGLFSGCEDAPSALGGAPKPQRADGARDVGVEASLRSNPMEIMPSGPAPDWAPDIDPQMLAVVETIEASAPSTPLTQLSPFQFRNLLSPVQAVREILRTTGTPPSSRRAEIGQRILPVGPPEGILVRTYTPFEGPGAHPVIVYFHGGGWVIADLDTYDASARALAEKTGAIVVSVAYRLAPEQLFPTAHEDAFAAYRWVTENTAEAPAATRTGSRSPARAQAATSRSRSR